MKRLKWILIPILAIILMSSNIDNVSAIEYARSYSRNLTTGTQLNTTTGIKVQPTFSNGGATFGLTSGTTSYLITSVDMCVGQYGFIENSLINFSIKYTNVIGSDNTEYIPITLYSTNSDYSIQTISYGEYGQANYTVYINEEIATANRPQCIYFWMLGNQKMVPSFTRIEVSSIEGIVLYNQVQNSTITALAGTVNQLLASNQRIEANLDKINQQLQSGNQIQQNIADNTDKTNDLLEEQQKKEEQQEQQYEQQQQENEQASEQQSQQTSQAGTSLLTAFTSFVNWIFTIKPGSCNIDMGNPYGFEIGQLNMCSYNPPAWVSGAIGVVVSLAIAAMSIHLVYRFINMMSIVAGAKGESR